MRRLAPAILILLLVPLCSPAEPLRIATYNLRNYLVQDRIVEGRWRQAYPKPESEKSALRRILLAVRPDVLAVQEIGGEPFLRELQSDLALDGLELPYLYWMEAPDPERHIAVLSKIPAVSVERHTDLDFAYLGGRSRVQRGMLELEFEATEGEGAWKVFVVHLKSPWTVNKEDPGSVLFRTREAEACRDRVIERTFGAGTRAFLVTGDFNDHPGSAALRRFQRRGDLAIGTYFPSYDSRGEVWTAFWKKESLYRTVDGFVLSEALLPHAVDGRGWIADLPVSLDASDHRLVYLDLQF